MPAHTSKTRVVKYDFDGDYDEPSVERILQRALAAGTITQFDCGASSDAGIVVWFEGAPGRELRRLRRAVSLSVRREEAPSPELRKLRRLARLSLREGTL
jgi:uncharacterized Ntn-hydrolase superfamily protein